MKQEGVRAARPRTRTVALIAAALGLVSVAVCFAFASFQLSTYGEAADALQARLAATSESIGPEVAAFETDPSTAEALSATLAEARSGYESARAEIASLEPPGLVPASRVEPHTRALEAYADSLIAYAELLGTSADYAVRRAEAFEEVATTLDGLQALSGEGLAVEEAQRLVGGVRGDFETVVARMHAEPPTQPVLYSNTHILWRLDDIAEPLTEIESAIAARDLDRIERAFESYAELAQTDWPSHLALHDREGRQVLESAARSAGQAGTALEETREPVDSLQQQLFLAAIVALVAGVLSALAAVALQRAGR